MEDKIIMSKKALERKTLLEYFKCNKLSLLDIAIRLNISYRQVKRIWKRYKEEGDQGLVHNGHGRTPMNAHSKDFKKNILNLYQEKYYEFGPTYAAEKMLEDDGLLINNETLRLWLKMEGLWSRKRKRKVHREKRERRANFGELLQIDGSIHKWFDQDEEHYCLLNMVDDATGSCLAKLDKGETTQVLLEVLRDWILKYGIPKAVYVDLKSVYVGFKKLKEKYDDDLLVQEGFSVFEQVCKALGIVIIRAYSAQAKGRVERKHAVFQDRFVKDLKLYNITEINTANIYLEKFLNKINQKFSKPINNFPDVHRNIDKEDLNEILCWRYKRKLRNDWTIQFKRDYFQIKKGYEQILNPGDFIVLKRYLDGSMKFWHEDSELAYQKLKGEPEPWFDECKYINKGKLSNTICWNYKRKLRDDWTIKLNNEYYQISKDHENLIRPGKSVDIKHYVDDTVKIYSQNTELPYVKIKAVPKLLLQPAKKDINKVSQRDSQLSSLRGRKNKHKTPWGQFNPDWLKNKVGT